jgi:RNA polymerase sigma factor (sigma-70 family)
LGASAFRLSLSAATAADPALPDAPSAATPALDIARKNQAVLPQPAASQEQQRLTRAAATRIWQQHRTYLYALSLRWLRGDRVEAEDAVADVIYKASLALGRSYHGIANERAWLTRVLHNRCIDVHRSRNGVRPLDAVANHQEAGNAATSGSDRSAEELFLNKELGEVMRRALAELPSTLRGPITMRLLNDESYSTISETFRISEANARKRIQQAREMLQRRLQIYLRGDDGRIAARGPVRRPARPGNGDGKS